MFLAGAVLQLYHNFSQTTSNFLERWLVPGRNKTKKKRGQAASKSSLSPDGASLVAQRLKRLAAMQETWVRSLGGEDPLEKEMATHCSTLAWEIPGTEEPDRLQSKGWQRAGHA